MIIQTYTVLNHGQHQLKIKRLSLKETTQQALLILPEIWGINLYILKIAEHYLKLGFDIFLPDIYWRQQENVALGYDEIDTNLARKLYENLDLLQSSQDIDQIIEFIFNLKNSYKLAILGFCMGGTLTYQINHPKVSALITYYGSQISNLFDAIKKIEKPILFHLAENDHLINHQEIASLIKLSFKKTNFHIFTYPNTGHGFDCAYRANFSLEASELALNRSKSFLIQNMA
ncbi:dienelactone hydrolase family protein [Acinetobacter bereziniae]|uniref:dienelactone hydrolase family protein n=1 Tax=Acinetobacter bereziniae TaxID=106648 RepID=UPI000C2BCC4E|nr:dienelactone hydrolase family protein [Acinetobacter bereziniae]ATZ63146.1 hypothetical protein BSR55_07220 [Acinetobacter bereziniae]MBJ8551063.1 dienelactone hydrolase family protein [Acinetobacter bereziniae]